MFKSMFEFTASKVNAANYCIMRFYLRYFDPSKPKPLRLSAYVRGSLLHNLIENFWLKFGTPKEIKINKKGQIISKKKYFDAENFSDYAQGKWMSIIMADKEVKKAEEKIYWTHDGQKWEIKSGLPKVCLPLFNHLYDEGPYIDPLTNEPISYVEEKFKFALEGRVFRGKIDKFFKKGNKVIIRDYKSGKPWVDEMKLDFDPQLTTYNLALSSMCYANKKLARKLGIEDAVSNQFMGNPYYINPDFQMEFFMLDGLAIDKENKKIRTIPNLINETKRNDNHYFALVQMIDGARKDIEAGNIRFEHGKKCGDCDMKVACIKKFNEIGSERILDKKNQLSFDFVFPDFVKKHEPPKKNKSQKKFRFRYKL